MNNDVVFEILLHLPVRSLLRFIRVSKLWHNIIASPHFKKLHSLRSNNNKDDKVYHLEFSFNGFNRRPDSYKISINLLDSRKSLKSHYFPLPVGLFSMDLSVVSGPVKGLVCLTSSHSLQIAICNPFLGQSKMLPLSPYCSSHSHRDMYSNHIVGLGFDEYYKVLELLPCSRCLHANLYSARTNSWKELDVDQELFIEKPIKSVCKNKSFAHWEVRRRGAFNRMILSFDMKNGVFRTITISPFSSYFAILAKDDCTFVILVLKIGMLKVYELRSEGSELIWNNVNNVKLEYTYWRRNNLRPSYEIPSYKNDNCVLVRGNKLKEVILYDYCAQKFISRFMKPKSSTFFDIRGLISP